jgi:dTDP-4-dehydrorhamnose 3,5-epimerase-like enzyme
MENKLKVFNDHRGGYLMPFEFTDLPFSPKRIFIINDVPKDGLRGGHAHYETQQILICVKGKILVILDHGDRIEEILIKSGETIFIDKYVWDSQKFLTGKDILCVLASTFYDINDYILDKEKFYKLKNRNDTSNTNP